MLSSQSPIAACAAVSFCAAWALSAKTRRSEAKSAPAMPTGHGGAWTDLCRDQQATGIGEDMTFSPFHLFGPTRAPAILRDLDPRAVDQPAVGLASWAFASRALVISVVLTA